MLPQGRGTPGPRPPAAATAPWLSSPKPLPRPLKSAEAKIVLQAIYPEYVTVRYTDPQYGPVTRTMYSNNIPTLCATVYEDGTAVWKELTFPLIER